MKYLSVCSGMEAASVAWKHLGWEAVGFSEIDPFPCEILKQRFPQIKNYGDLKKYKEWDFSVGDVDILIGGTPCQPFSISGLRQGLDDPRGNLALVFLGLAEHIKPRWIIWENVVGVLSSNDGRDFSSFVGALVKIGYGFFYRILDAEYVGGAGAVPQRRRRVYLVGYLGDWRPAAAVILDPKSIGRDKQKDCERAVSPTIQTTCNDYSRADGFLIIDQGDGPRRMSCVEAERLMGFPDNWSRISWNGRPEEECPEGPRYKACGNSMATNVVKWIGDRINQFENNVQK